MSRSVRVLYKYMFVRAAQIESAAQSEVRSNVFVVHFSWPDLNKKERSHPWLIFGAE